MPTNYKTYPIDWFTRIRPEALKRAGNCCQKCGEFNYSLIFRSGDSYCTNATYKEALKRRAESGIADALTIVVLTVVHLDRFMMNNAPENLRALCLHCANRRDAKRRAVVRKTKRQAYLDHIQPPLVFATSTISIL